MGEIQDELKSIRTLLEEKDKKKEKKFRLPMSAKVNKSRAKQNWVTVMKINENGHVNFKRFQITKQTIVEEGIPRLATAGYVTYYKNNPLIILPSWSVEPFSPRDHYEKSMIDGSNTKGFQLLMDKMKSETLNPKKPMGNMIKWIIGIGLAVIIGYALITGGG